MLRNMQLVRGVGISAALALTVFMAGCGGGDDASNEATKANFQFGQANFKDVTANRGFAPTGSTLSGPSSIATNGTLFYVADTNNNRVLGFLSLPTAATTTADFVIGQNSLTTNTPGSTATSLAQPIKVSISGTKLIVVDRGNNRVLIWNTLPTSNVPANVTIGDGSATVSATSLAQPNGAVFAGSKLVVADSGNNRVLIYNTVTNNAAASLVLGQRNMTDKFINCPQETDTVDICSASKFAITDDSLRNPKDVWSDGFSLVVSDTGNNRVLYWNTFPAASDDGATYIIGQSNRTLGGVGTGPAGLTSPANVWVDPSTQYIYVADAGNNRVLSFAPPSLDGPTAYAVYGQGDFLHYTANDDDQDRTPDTDSNDRAEASDRTLNGALGMTTFGTSLTNVVFVADTQNNRVIAFNTR